MAISPQQVVLGIDIGGTNMRFGLVGQTHEMEAFERVSSQEIFAGEGELTQKLAQCIQDYCDRHLGGQLPRAVSIGFPSTINRQRTILLQTPNISAIPDHFPMVESLEKVLQIPVFINRDVNNLLLFDLEDLEVKTQNCVAGIYFGTGVGNAILVDGKILLGKNGVAAEMGHIPIYGNKRICTCGNESCLETVVSGVALERLQQEYFPETHISSLFKTHPEAPQIQAFITGMAQAVAAEVNLLDPDCVILGGGLMQMSCFPKELLEKEVHYYTRKPYPECVLDIRYSRPNQANGVVGAAIYAEKRLADKNYL